MTEHDIERCRVTEDGGVKWIVGDRGTGRTTKLLQLASEMQQAHDLHTTIIVSPYYQRADRHHSREAMHWIQRWLDSDGERGLDPARTIIESPYQFAYRNRGQWWAKPDGHQGPHHVFAFIDDSSEFRPGDFDMLCNEMSMVGIAISAVVL